jgi:DNA-binding beta-propeller fold protein YncE
MKVKHLLAIVAAVLVTIGVVTFFSGTPVVKKGPQFLYSISGSFGQSLLEPAFAIADDKGVVFVADSGNRRIRVFSDKGRFLYEFGGPRSVKELLYPYGIGFVEDKVIVADTGAGALYEFNRQGEYVGTWLEPKTGVEPAGVFVAPDRNVYVTDLAGGRVLVFSGAGKLLREIKPRQVALGAPQGIAVNKDGGVWVADGGNYNVKLLRPDGDLQTIFDGGPKGALTMAKGLAVDKKGRIYVADTLSKIIRVFDQDGNDLAGFGRVADGTNSLQLPVGLSVDGGGKIYVADQGSNMVHVWAWK